MLKKRMLLLAAALAAFGAVMVSGAFATPSGTASANSSNGVSGPAGNGNYVIETPSLSASINIPLWSQYTIAPDGNWHSAGKLTVTNNTSYAVTVTDVDVTSTAQVGCGANPPPGLDAQFTAPVPSADIAGGGASAQADFELKLGPSALITNSCQFNGTVTVTAEQDLTP
jgi:hypothetical protein